MKTEVYGLVRGRPRVSGGGYCTTVTLRKGPTFVTCEDYPNWDEANMDQDILDSHFTTWVQAARQGVEGVYATTIINGQVVKINH